MQIEVPRWVAVLLADLAPQGVDPADFGMGLLTSKVCELATTCADKGPDPDTDSMHRNEHQQKGV